MQCTYSPKVHELIARLRQEQCGYLFMTVVIFGEWEGSGVASSHLDQPALRYVSSVQVCEHDMWSTI